jgi:hypothetical protein
VFKRLNPLLLVLGVIAATKGTTGPTAPLSEGYKFELE